MIIRCENCKKEVAALLITGAIAYPHRKDLCNLYFWQCPICKNFVGTHKNSTKHIPLGSIPNKELKYARMKAHYYIDKLWKEKLYTRQEVYQLISDYMGFRYHNATTRNAEECEKALNYAKELYRNKKRRGNE